MNAPFDADALLEALHALDVRIWLDDGRLRYSAPTGVLTPELLSRMRAHREVLVERVAARARPAPVRTARPAHGLPLSSAQQRLWFIEQTALTGHAYNTPLNLRMVGALDEMALEAALQAIVRRHESLRTAIRQDGGIPLQHVVEIGHFDLPVTDLRVLGPEQALAQAMALAAAHNAQPFDLAEPPLVRARLARLGDREAALLLVFHHIVFDGWSMGVFAAELGRLYDGFVAAFRTDPALRPAAGTPVAAPTSRELAAQVLQALDIQYPDYAVWQRERLASPSMAAHLAWWKDALRDAAPTDIPTDRARPAVQRFRGATVEFRLPPALGEALERFARERAATPFMVLLGVFQALLQRSSGQERPVVGTPVANRGHAGVERLIGFFVNTLVLRGDLRGRPSLHELTARNRDLVVGALTHQELPFEALVEALNPPRDLSRPPLFQHLFAVQQSAAMAPRFELDGLCTRPLPLTAVAARFELEMHLWPRNGEAQGGSRDAAQGRDYDGLLVYDADLYESATADRLVRRFVALLEAALREPDRPLCTLARDAVAGAPARPTWFDAPGARCLHGLFAEAAARHGPKTAVVGPEPGLPGAGPIRLSYAELDALSGRMAAELDARLRAAGVPLEAGVALSVERTPWMLVAFLAILRCGRCYIPLDPRDRSERIRAILDDGRPALLVTDSADSAPGGESGVPVVRFEALLRAAREEGPRLHVEVPADALCAVIYTSGSTGRPKGVELPHAVYALYAGWHLSRLDRLGDPDLVTAQFAQYSFDIFFQETFSTWLGGGRLEQLSQDEREDPEALAERIVRSGVERIALPPAVLVPLAAALERRDAGHGLREIYAAGEPLLIGPALRVFFRRRPRLRLHNHYGPTESFITATHVLDGEASDWPERPPVGEPTPMLALRVLDPDGTPLGTGLPGELVAGGLGLARGYRGRPDLTAERFVPDPDGAPGARTYRTGDRARWRRPGELEHLGRLDAQLKVRGYRVEPAEIELVIAAHEAVARCAVVVDTTGALHGLVAVCVPSDPTRRPTESVRERLRIALPSYMQPARLLWVEAIPLTGAGKVDLRAAAAHADRDAPGDRAAGAAPVTGSERLVGSTMAALLGRGDDEALGPDEDFFIAGGHSLLATRLVSRLRDALGANVPLRWVFEHPTVRALAQRLDARAAEGGAGVLPLTPGIAQREFGAGPYPLSSAQRRLWLIDRLDLSGVAYIMPIALRMEGRLDVEALRGAIADLVLRHEPLRTVMTTGSDGEALQRVLPFSPPPLPEIDLQGAVPPDVDRCLEEDRTTPFDLARSPPLRLRLLRLGPQRVILSGALHHVAGDGWSIQVFARELSEHYRRRSAAVRGEAIDVGSHGAAPSIRYVDFAVWQRALLGSPALAASLEQECQRLRGIEPLRLPLDRPRPAVERFNGEALPVRLPAGLSEAVSAWARRHDATPYMALLAGFLAVLSRWSGQSRVAVGSPVAHRVRSETEGLIGLFVNSLVMDADLGDDPSADEMLQRVRRSALAAFAHQDLPFERLVEALQGERDLGRNPLFQVVFALQSSASMAPRFEMPGLQVRPVAASGMTVRFDLELHLWPHDPAGSAEPAELRGSGDGLGDDILVDTLGGYRGFVAFNRDLFDRDTVARLMTGYRDLLAAMVEAPDEPIGRHIRLSSVDARLLARWSGPAAGVHRDPALLHELFDAVARRCPHAPALRAPDGRRLTYEQVKRRSLAWAAALAREGVGPGDRVALDLPRGVETVLAMLAVLRLGAAYVPLDEDWPPSRRDRVLSLAAPRKVLSPSELARLDARLDEDDASVPALASRLIGIGPSVLPAYTMFTSGSTGTPKGVTCTHDNVARLAFADFMDWSDGEVVMHGAPIAFDASTFEIWAPLLNGAEIALLPSGRVGLDELAAFLSDGGVTAAWLTAGLFHEMVAAHPACLAALRTVIAGGDVLDPTKVREMLSGTGGQGRGAVLINGYGPTENTTFTACHRVTPGGLPEPVPGAAPASVPIGVPITGSTVHILDAQGQLLPPGVVGELHTGGRGVATGYTGSPAETAERFVPDPFGAEPGARLYRTGDLARWRNDGTLEFLGRRDEQVKIRGFRVEAAEVELALQSHPDVRQAAVAVEREGPGGARLRAWVVPRPGVRDERGHVEDWARLFDQRIYGAAATADPLFDTSGWISTYDGTPLPEAQMRDWAAETVGKVLGRRPGAIAEVGCGTGMLLFQLAPQCLSYRATDISDEALARIAARVPRAGGPWPQLRLLRRPADDFADVESGSLDTVLLSSVIQYFPSLEYLLQVLRAALSALRPGGTVHLADVRHAGLLELLHAGVALARSPQADPAGRTLEAAEQLGRREAELLVDPGLWAQLAHDWPEIGRIHVEMQSGAAHNELTRYRYTVLLERAAAGNDSTAVRPVPVELDARGWSEARLGEALAALGARRDRPVLAMIRGLRNARLIEDEAACGALAQARHDGSLPDAAALRRRVREQVALVDDAVDPARACAMARAAGLQSRIGWSTGDGLRFDLGLWTEGSAAPTFDIERCIDALPSRSWARWVREPAGLSDRHPAASVDAPDGALEQSGADAARWIDTRVMPWLSERLPAPFLPESIETVDRLPLGPNGKVDRRALLQRRRRAAPNAGTAHQGEPDALVAQLLPIWRQVLGRPEAGPDDDFFRLGGHSLLAARWASRLGRELGREVALRAVFEHPVLADLVAFLQRRDDASGGTAASDPLRPDVAARHDPFPLTDVQQAYWIGRADAFEGGDTAAHLYLEIDADGLDLARLEAAFNRLVARHDMLRAIVLPEGLQRVLPSVPDYRIEVRDLRHMGADAREAALRSERERLEAQVLPADRWPLFEITASRFDDRTCRIHVSLDVLVFDAHSLNLFFDEWHRSYQDPGFEPAPLGITFRDHVTAQIALEGSAAYAQSRDWWMERLATLPSAPQLPLARRTPREGAPQFVLLSRSVDRSRWRTLRERGARRGLTPSALLLAAFSCVLARWSRSPSFTLNLTLFSRSDTHPDLNRVLGDFTAIDLLAVDSPLDATFEQAAERLQRQLREDLAHPYPGGVRVMRELARRLGRPPGMLMPVVFSSLLGQSASAPSGDAALTRFGRIGHASSQTPQVWLDHGVNELDGELILTWNVVEALFPPGMIRDMLDAYVGYVHRLADDAAAWGMPARGLLPAAQQAVRQAANATASARAPGLLHDPAIAAARAHPEWPAVIDGGLTLTHGELLGRAHVLARQVGAFVRGPDCRVAVVMPKGWEQVVATMAILMAGAAYMPVDPGVPGERLRLLLGEGRPCLVLASRGLAAGVGALDWPSGLPVLDVTSSPPEDPGAAPHPPWLGPESLAYVIFTSGSTGRPKGVMIQHAAALNTLLDLHRRCSLTRDDRVLAVSNLNFDLSVFDLFGVLGAGGTVVMPGGAAERDPARWVELVVRHRVTVWNSVPALAQLLLDGIAVAGDAPSDGALPGLRLCMMSGDWIPLQLLPRLERALPHARLLGLGGATEASIWSNWHPIDTAALHDWSSVPYGTPLENQTMEVLDTDFEPRPDWVPGEIHIGGAGLALGYHDDPVRTAERFVVHPRTGRRLYRTGDLGCVRPDGVIEFLGREDSQVKVHGHRIELGEIDAALAAVPGIEEGVSAAVDDPRGGRMLVGYVVPRRAEGAVGLLDPDGFASILADLASFDAHDEPADPAFSLRWTRANEDFVRQLRHALVALGAYAVEGERYDVDALLMRTRIVPRYRRWIRRALATLVEQGWLDVSDTVHRSRRGLLDDATGPDAHGRLLADVLTERVHSAQLYADPAVPELYERLFGACNRIAARALARTVRAHLAVAPRGTPLRVLEVGAGYGTTTRHLLPVLEGEGAPEVRYLYTDVSRFFLDHGREQFGRLPGFDTALFDIDLPGPVQGVPAHSIDVIVAASVLHDARDIRATLSQLAALLAPGGLMLIVEETRFHPVFDLGMGLQQGFDRFTDEALRPMHPLLDREQWCAELLRAGLLDPRVLHRSGSVSDHLGMDVLVARGSAQVRLFDPAAIETVLARTLPAYMVPRHWIPLERLPLSANGKVDRKSLPRPDPGPHGPARTVVEPADPLERRVRDVWEDLLGESGLSVEDDLFARGADSLLATRATTRLRAAFSLPELPLRMVFDHPTVRGQAREIGRRTGAGSDLETFEL